MAQKVLILGASGMLGHDLQKVYPDAVCRGHELDITDEAAVFSFISDLKPSLVINAAAFTNVDGCEDHEDLAFAVNGEGPGYIAAACHEVGATLVHYSTDYVFDGSHSSYVEDDRPKSINVYGASKLQGEQAIIAAMEDYRIVRTSWLFGLNGLNFVETMLRLSAEMEKVRVVDDQFGKPTYTVDLAEKTPEIAKAEPGIYHITNEGVCSWYNFASGIIPNVESCSSREFLRPAKRPKFSVLENTKTSPMRPWRDALKDYLKIRTQGSKETSL
ncbi:dTDP-4-dehydrorhamnose reductase [Methanogenium organophilum]|uniref:dTDP-4-dehydrorhamnose reductase n=1 Tax=Methanogenium organophilum TaxID=2199 RepID=A0A9X9T7W8_METOG|nr:dTDP-4-dehydrorhamnose reductase [Methanogenium organophilum]WAI00836.1 dTDP-4-dehydrorhamnose reductase [Methanogenium organophilum]